MLSMPLLSGSVWMKMVLYQRAPFCHDGAAWTCLHLIPLVTALRPHPVKLWGVQPIRELYITSHSVTAWSVTPSTRCEQASRSNLFTLQVLDSIRLDFFSELMYIHNHSNECILAPVTALDSRTIQSLSSFNHWLSNFFVLIYPCPCFCFNHHIHWRELTWFTVKNMEISLYEGKPTPIDTCTDRN